MFHQHGAMVLVDCEQANMVVVFVLNEYVFQDDIPNRIDLLSDLLPVISLSDYKNGNSTMISWHFVKRLLD